MNDLKQLAKDIYFKRTGDFSQAEAENTLRQSLIELCGTDKIDYKTMRKFKPEVFEILEETLDEIVGYNIEQAMADFAEYRNLSWGDTTRFEIPNNELFKVALVTDGSSNLRRQRIDNGFMTVETATRGVKIFEEFHRFLAGRIDWTSLVNRVSKSYINELYTLVYKALYESYSDLSATYGKTGTYSATTLSELIQHVEASNGTSALILGTKSALAKVAPSQISESMKDTFNKMGYYGEFQGTAMREIKQVHTHGTDTFAIDSNFILVIPVGEEKLVKIVDEGESIILETAGGQNADMSMEYTFIKKSGIGVLTASKYGMYKIS